MRERRTGGVPGKGLALLALVAALFVACENPTGSAIGSNTSGGPGGVPGGGSGDAPPTPITITFVLDMDVTIPDGPAFSLSTNAAAPAPITAIAGVPVRLDQGIGFTATGPNLANPGSTITYHASGWSTESYSTQFVKIFDSTGPAPSGAGYYLPGFEAIFTEDTTLRIRWLPELENISAQVTYHEPGAPSNTKTGPILHVRDQLPFETTAQFTARLSPSWSVPENQGVFRWLSAQRPADQFTVTQMGDSVAVWQLYTNNFGNLPPSNLGFLGITLSYETRPVWTVTFDYNGATGGIGDVTRATFDDVPLPSNPGWSTFIEPTRGNLRFAGWYTEPEGGSQWSNAFLNGWDNNQRAFNDVTLYARWVAEVTFVPNNGGSNGLEIVQVNANGTVTVALPSLTPGYSVGAYADILDGWYADSNWTNKVAEGIAESIQIELTGDTTLYAGWRSALTVGDFGPAGGRVFYVAGGSGIGSTQARDWRFLEAAPVDLTGTYQWGLWGTDGTLNNRDFEWFSSGSHNSLGGGFESTQAIINRITASTDSQKSNYGNTAAHAADSHSIVNDGVTYDDWYLPSVNELLQIGNLWTALGLLDETSGIVRYWSSTSYNAPGYSIGQMEGRAFTVGRNPTNGSLTLDPPAAVTQRIAERRVRPVRRF